MLKNSRLALFFIAGIVSAALFTASTFLHSSRTQPASTLAAATTQVNNAYLTSISAPELYPLRDWSVALTDIKASSAIAIELPSGKILYGKNVFEPRPVASISKLVTALVAIKHLPPLAQVTISQTAVDTLENSAHLVQDQVFTVNELLYALLLESSNDAAIALAEYYESNRTVHQKSFVTLMNEEVAALNLTTSHFSEPTGLSAQNTSSAFDIARILYTASQVQTIADIMRTPRYLVRREMLITHEWLNSNKLLLRSDVIGGKTGFTDEAGDSLALLAESDAHTQLAIVVLDAQNREDQASHLLDWLKSAYMWGN